jgi:hypothetical protein
VAQPVRRVRKSDGITTVQVKWRQGGRGSAWQSETFASGTTAQNEARAMAFRVDVEEAGNRWPAGWTPGEGYLHPGPAALPVGATTDTAGVATTEVTTAELAADYFRHQRAVRVSRHKVKLTEVERREATWRNHLAETFGHLPVAAVTREDVEDWITQQVEEVEAAAASVRHRHWVLSTVFKHAMTRMRPALRVDNPCFGSELPEPADARQVRFFQEGEWALLRACLDPDVRDLVDVLFVTGARWGEATAVMAHRQPVQPSNTSSTSPSNWPSHLRNPTRSAGMIRPRLASPVSSSTQSKVICCR